MNKLEINSKFKRRGAQEFFSNGNYIEVRCKNGSFFIDSDDLFLLEENSWKINSMGYVAGSSASKYGLIHRAVMRAKRNQRIDHINGNPLDNRKKNLRLCTQSQNCANAKKRKNTSSKFKGVCNPSRKFSDGSERYIAYIDKNGKRISLGHYRCEISAAKAYNYAAKKIFGEFARLNEVDSE